MLYIFYKSFCLPLFVRLFTHSLIHSFVRSFVIHFGTGCPFKLVFEYIRIHSPTLTRAHLPRSSIAFNFTFLRSSTVANCALVTFVSLMWQKLEPIFLQAVAFDHTIWREAHPKKNYSKMTNLNDEHLREEEEKFQSFRQIIRHVSFAITKPISMDPSASLFVHGYIKCMFQYRVCISVYCIRATYIIIRTICIWMRQTTSVCINFKWKLRKFQIIWETDQPSSRKRASEIDACFSNVCCVTLMLMHNISVIFSSVSCHVVQWAELSWAVVRYAIPLLQSACSHSLSSACECVTNDRKNAKGKETWKVATSFRKFQLSHTCTASWPHARSFTHKHRAYEREKHRQI